MKELSIQDGTMSRKHAREADGSGSVGRPDQSNKLAYSIPEAADALSIGLTTIKELVRTGEIQSIRVGRRRLIPRTQLEAFLALKCEESRLTETTMSRLQDRIDEYKRLQERLQP